MNRYTHSPMPMVMMPSMNSRAAIDSSCDPMHETITDSDDADNHDGDDELS